MSYLADRAQRQSSATGTQPQARFTSFHKPDNDEPTTQYYDGPFGSGKPIGDGADANFATIIREQWDDYVQRFQGLEDIAIEDYMDPEKRQANRDRLVDMAGETTANAFDRQRARSHEFRQGYGLSQGTAEEQTIRARGSRVAQAAATTKARNDTRSYLDQRERELLVGASSA